MGADFNVVNAFWVPKGTDNDAHIQKELDQVAHPLRHCLSQLRIVGNVPPIQFVKGKISDFYQLSDPHDVTLFNANYNLWQTDFIICIVHKVFIEMFLNGRVHFCPRFEQPLLT